MLTLENTALLRRLRNLAAFGSIALVLFLSVLAVRPDFHGQLHVDAADADHDCAISLFSNGVTHAVDTAVLGGPVWAQLDLSRPAPVTVALVSAEHLRPPERAPPAA
jgi:hypothetical protein